MPHLPNPMGRYPLTLRDANVNNPVNGELMYDYNTDELKYSDLESGKVNSVAKNIYDKIVSTRIENTKIELCKSENVPTTEEIKVVPPIDNRKMNTFYVNIQNVEPLIKASDKKE